MPGECIIMLDTQDWFTKACLVVAVIGGCMSEVFCICIGYSILYVLKKSSANFSKATFRLHRQVSLQNTQKYSKLLNAN